METKTLTINDDCYMFVKLDELVEMLKEDDYKVTLNIKGKISIRNTIIKL